MAEFDFDNAPAVRCTALEKRYPDVLAVAGIDLEVRAGECLAVLGPNGAGKTTTVEMIEGLTAPSAGRIEVFGRPWGQGARSDRAIRGVIGVQLQETHFQEKLTIDETLAMFHSFFPVGQSADDVLAMVALEGKRAARVGKLSGGQKQRLALACALIGAPRLLCLDEPTTGLDPQSRRQLWEVVEAFQARGGTVLLTTHYMEEAARLADRVAIMDHGKVIAEDTPDALVASLGADQVIELELEGAPPVGLDALPGVRAVRPHGDAIRLSVGDVARVMPGLLAHLEAVGAPLQNLSTHRATLEDVFVEKTGRALRE
ncbi:MAG: ABC transporter ATP-binding protein [Deltaproteobacteria bacterium]|nr:ABC transporter ATP-binding protein [Deltaproteobacteria bacterium]